VKEVTAWLCSLAGRLFKKSHNDCLILNGTNSALDSPNVSDKSSFKCLRNLRVTKYLVFIAWLICGSASVDEKGSSLIPLNLSLLEWFIFVSKRKHAHIGVHCEPYGLAECTELQHMHRQYSIIIQSL